MKATFQDQLLFEGDFLREWQEVEDESVDLILTDPPYGSIKRGHVNPWDVRPDFHVLAWIFSHLLHPTGQVAVFASFDAAFEVQSAFERYFDFRFSWCWAKPSVIPVNRFQPAPDIELILIYKVKGTRTHDLTFNLEELKEGGQPYIRPAGWNQNRNPTKGNSGNLPETFVNESGKRYPRSVLHFPNKPCMSKAERTTHPTQKPLGLLEYILKGLSNPDDTILDPFTGSGSTLVACHRLNRQGIGFEMASEYFDMARNRLEQETRQGVLI